MPSLYKTPGAYIEEIPKFPPSIAPVETAIPAFIGYTEKITLNGETLKLKPTPIESIAEFEEIYGVGPQQNVEVFLDGNNNFVKAQASTSLYLYDSMRLFYANGGGKCYVVSVGDYASFSAGSDTPIQDGIDALESEDEPTIIVSPDAVSATSGPYEVQKKALMQCNKLKDRVVLCDLVKPSEPKKFDETVTAFRTGIGINNLKYGMAYAPWINANLPRTIWRRNLVLKRQGDETVLDLASLTTDDDIKAAIADVKLAETAGETLESVGKPDVDLQKALDAYRLLKDDSTFTEVSAALKGVSAVAFAVLAKIQSVNSASYPTDTKFEIVKSVSTYLKDKKLKDSILALAAHHNELQAPAADKMEAMDTASADVTSATKLLSITDLLHDPALPNVDSSYTGLTIAKEKGDVALDAAHAAALNAIAMFTSLQESARAFEKTLNEALLAKFARFKELSQKGAEALNLLPPSGAIAGVYAAVDRERGVWKAPANVSLNAVTSPHVKITHDKQGEYNVDVNAGKSINIIRAFTGKGILVWGARTLAGNDNEWRYVNVRRLFNMVEESCKKATEQFVFEPNDANTWVRVQGMIENFLTVLWRQGALQGVKPEHAFYVAVGLGKTMTALDILEGRMIVEIGLAAVRPAEFIILRFSHKMPES